MISIRCPHCHVGLKVDESKIPANIQTFNCPKCKLPIPISYVLKNQVEDDSETVILSFAGAKGAKAGKIHVLPNDLTPEQTIQLVEGVNIVGRKSPIQKSTTAIDTKDKLMSRSHIVVEVRKTVNKDDYIYYLYDNKSTNRTLYNNKYIEPGEVITLKNNDEIQIGQTRLIFKED
jgi:predicted Zn finger-like uncharacterized protein